MSTLFMIPPVSGQKLATEVYASCSTPMSEEQLIRYGKRSPPDESTHAMRALLSIGGTLIGARRDIVSMVHDPTIFFRAFLAAVYGLHAIHGLE